MASGRVPHHGASHQRSKIGGSSAADSRMICRPLPRLRFRSPEFTWTLTNRAPEAVRVGARPWFTLVWSRLPCHL